MSPHDWAELRARMREAQRQLEMCLPISEDYPSIYSAVSAAVGLTALALVGLETVKT